ncbi:hypothetical protein [Pyrococcus kukulkanii]
MEPVVPVNPAVEANLPHHKDALEVTVSDYNDSRCGRKRMMTEISAEL